MPQVHLVCRPASGGILTHIAGLLTDLPSANWRPTLHAPKRLLKDLDGRLMGADVFPLEIPARFSANDLSIAKQLAQQVPVDAIIHAHGIRAAWISMIARRFKKFHLIVTLHNVPPGGAFTPIVLRLIEQDCDRIVCVSTFIAARIRSPKTTVIPNGILIDPSSTKADRRNLYPAITGDTFLVFCASRLAHEKGIDILIGAARLSPRFQFAIAGDGPLKHELELGAPANVRFLGRRTDVRSLMQAADCVVVPSRTEGQGIVVLEGFAAKTPVVATRVGGIPESVDDGFTGTLVAPESPDELARALAFIQAEPDRARGMADEAYRWVQNHRSRPVQSLALAQEYQKLARA